MKEAAQGFIIKLPDDPHEADRQQFGEDRCVVPPLHGSLSCAQIQICQGQQAHAFRVVSCTEIHIGSARTHSRMNAQNMVKTRLKRKCAPKRT